MQEAKGKGEEKQVYLTSLGNAIVGNYAYVAHFSGLQIIDISNPSNPTLKGNYDTYFAYGVEI